MTLSKVFLPLLASSAFLGGCVYEEVDTGYREPRRVYHRGYDEPTVVVEKRHRDYYDDRPRGYYRERPVTVYEERPRVYHDGGPRIYGGGTVVVTPGRHGESYKERQEREEGFGKFHGA